MNEIITDEIKADVFTLYTIAVIGSCTCLTKTNEVKYHEEDCHYRLVSEAQERILWNLEELKR